MKFKVSNKNMDGHLLFEYDSNGFLKVFECHANLTDQQGMVLMSRFPINFEVYEWFIKASKSVSVKIPEDLSFDKFWNTYAYKVGKKNRTQKLWEALSEAERVDVLNSIQRYNAWLRGRTIERVYPETYLAQERWKNAY